MGKCKYTRDSEIGQYTPECCLDDEYPSTAVHTTDMTEWTYCPYCSGKIQAYTDGKVFKAAKYTEADIKQSKLEVLEDVIDMLNKEAVDRNCEGVYRWNVPLSVAVDEINLLKQQIESE